MDSKTNVHVFLMYTGYIREELAWWRVKWAGDARYDVTVEGARHRPIASNRNQATKRFLASDGDFMMMIDDDVIPAQNPLDLVLMDKDIVCFPTPMWAPGRTGDYPIHMNVELMEHPEGLQDNYILISPEPLMEIAAGGTGCILIARRVLEHPDLRPAFMDMYDEDGIRSVTEDITFIRRARVAGFSAWAAMEYRCSHVKEVDLLMIDLLYRRLLNKKTADA
jgi:hypothetical protein